MIGESILRSGAFRAAQMTELLGTCGYNGSRGIGAPGRSVVRYIEGNC